MLTRSVAVYKSTFAMKGSMGAARVSSSKYGAGQNDILMTDVGDVGDFGCICIGANPPSRGSE